MKNFEFYSPTKVFFGKDEHKRVGEIIKGYGFKRVMLHYGGGSIKKSGLYDTVMHSLRENAIEVVELGGVEPNPKLSLVMRGAQVARESGAELILAVGGGSAIDSSKLIAATAKTDMDPWLFSTKKATPTDALPVATILTLSASGSETSASAVITNDELHLKRGYNSNFNRPLFSILDPTLTYTVSKYQTACGIVDIMMHTIERYMTQTDSFEITDRIAEGLLKSVIAAGRVAINNPKDYQARATLMWAGSLSHNDLTGAGRNYFMVSHQIEHELSGMFENIAHGAGLAVVFPAWAMFMYKHNLPRFCQYAQRVWNVDYDFSDPQKTALSGIRLTKDFFRQIGMPTDLNALNVPESAFEEMAIKCTNYGERILPGAINCGKDEIIEIFNLMRK